MLIAPVSSLKKTKSENVPPVSTVTRYFAIGVSSIIKKMGLQSYFGRVEMLRLAQHDTQKHRHPERSEGSNPRLMLPYSIAFAIGWTALLALWLLLGIPLGPGSGMVYPPV